MRRNTRGRYCTLRGLSDGEVFVLSGATGGLNRPTPIYDARSGQKLR